MTRVIIAATPAYGHMAPLRSIAADLLARGHRVTFLTGSAFKATVEAAGVRFVPLQGNADFDASDPLAFPARAAIPPGPAQIDFDIRHQFAEPIAE